MSGYRMTDRTRAVLIEECGSCGSVNLDSVLRLGATPPTCAMRRAEGLATPEVHYPLELLRCADCTLVQLSCVVSPEVVFPPDYPYSSGNSGELRRNFDELARNVSRQLKPGDTVVDVGANDGTLLRAIDREGPGDLQLVGVEPTGQGQHIAEEHHWFHSFLTLASCHMAREMYGRARLITACNVLAHIADIHDALEGIHSLLADGGLLIVENHDLASIVDGGQWDTVYHEHLRFFTPYSFAQLAAQHGLHQHRHVPIDTHGGSFRMFLHREYSGSRAVGDRDYDFAGLARRADRARWHLRSRIAAQRAGGERVMGIGATARATTLIGHCGLSESDIAAVAEVPGSEKIGRWIPGTRIPVISEDALFTHGPENALLFSWHLAKLIVPKLRAKGYQGTMIVPLPEVSTVR